MAYHSSSNLLTSLNRSPTGLSTTSSSCRGLLREAFAYRPNRLENRPGYRSCFVEETKLVGCLGPHFGEHPRVEWRTVGYHFLRLHAKLSQTHKEGLDVFLFDGS